MNEDEVWEWFEENWWEDFMHGDPEVEDKKIIKAMCLEGLLPPLLAIRYNPESELYTVDILRGSDGWWHVSTHVSLKRGA